MSGKQITHRGPENLKKSRQKKLVKSNKSKKFFTWNCIFGSFKLFPSSKIDFFGHFWNNKKWILVKFVFREIDSLISQVFSGFDFFTFSGLQFFRHFILTNKCQNVSDKFVKVNKFNSSHFCINIQIHQIQIFGFAPNLRDFANLADLSGFGRI